MLYIKYGKISEFGATCESLVTNSSAIPVLFQRNPTIPVPFRQIPVIPADSGAIPAELPDSRRNLWGTVKYWAYMVLISISKVRMASKFCLKSSCPARKT